MPKLFFRLYPLHCITLKTLFLLMLIPFSANSQETVALQPYAHPITMTGFTYPLQEMIITSEVNGRCLGIAADIGEAVPENGRLVEIDATFIELEIEANRIAKEQATRQLAQEEKSLSRYTTLLNQKSAPQAQLDEVTLAADLHRITLKKLHNEEQRLKEQLTRHTITAPPGWLLIERYSEPGELIQANKPVVRLGDFDKLRIPLAVTYDELQAISAIPNILLRLPDLKTTIPATIYRTSPVFDPQTRKIQLELAINAKGNGIASTLRGGMRAELEFVTTNITGTFTIPTSALISRYEAHWLMRPDGTRVQVIFQDQSEDGFAIISGNGLQAKDQFLANPQPSR